ncbi:hypothetical protein BaRGS_00016138 [Batillaria attramentaria]|uniref:Uncharacterized protein n=1 Tax=Batillaria attramentaria TaxID=370345 RepID=A0ABD0KZJ7_9CAEN
MQRLGGQGHLSVSRQILYIESTQSMAGEKKKPQDHCCSVSKACLLQAAVPGGQNQDVTGDSPQNQTKPFDCLFLPEVLVSSSARHRPLSPTERPFLSRLLLSSQFQLFTSGCKCVL